MRDTKEATIAIGRLLMQKLAGEISEEELHAQLSPLVKEAAAPKPLFSTLKSWITHPIATAKKKMTPKALYTTLGVGGLGIVGGGILGNRRYQQGVFQSKPGSQAVPLSQQGLYRPYRPAGTVPYVPGEGVPPVPALPGYYPTGMIDPRISTQNIQ